MAETFGYTDKGGQFDYYATDRIEACKFQSGSAGSLASISVYIEYYAAANAKCAIYDADKNKIANGETEEKAITSGMDGFIVFNFGETKPVVLAETDYYLCIFASYFIKNWYGTAAGQTIYDTTNAYNGWPDTLTQSGTLNRKYSMYATYEEAPPPAVKAIVQAALISIPLLIVLPTLSQIIKLTGGC